MAVKQMTISDLAKSDATTVVAYRDGFAIKESTVRSGYLSNPILEAHIKVANTVVQLVLDDLLSNRGT